MTLATAWMWLSDEGDTNGATLDADENRIQWFDSGIGCACGDSAVVQSFEQFEQGGAALFGVPEDILAEMAHAIKPLRNDHA